MWFGRTHSHNLKTPLTIPTPNICMYGTFGNAKLPSCRTYCRFMFYNIIAEHDAAIIDLNFQVKHLTYYLNNAVADHLKSILSCLSICANMLYDTKPNKIIAQLHARLPCNPSATSKLRQIRRTSLHHSAFYSNDACVALFFQKSLTTHFPPVRFLAFQSLF